MGRRRDASPRRRPGTTFLNYNKDIIRVITAVQGASLRKTIKLLIMVSRAIYSVKNIGQIISFLSLALKLLPLVVQGLVVGQGVF